MGGGSKEPQVTEVPLMSPEQNQLLGDLLTFLPQAMGGFQLGEAYGGPSEASYSPFTIPEGGGKGGPPTGGRRDRDVDRGTRRGGGDDDGGRGGGGGQVRARDRSRPALDGILNSEPNLPVSVPESQPISPIEQALTQPIISPFTQGMTGNYPRRPGRRGEG